MDQIGLLRPLLWFESQWQEVHCWHLGCVVLFACVTVWAYIRKTTKWRRTWLFCPLLFTPVLSQSHDWYYSWSPPSCENPVTFGIPGENKYQALPYTKEPKCEDKGEVGHLKWDWAVICKESSCFSLKRWVQLRHLSDSSHTISNLWEWNANVWTIKKRGESNGLLLCSADVVWELSLQGGCLATKEMHLSA